MTLNLDFLFYTFPVFLFCLTFHEYMHARVANWGGDSTATYQGRLTLNPIAHIDPVGTILFPLLGGLSGGMLFGWAKPVPVNELRFRDLRWNVAVALVGPFSHVLLVIFGGLFLSLLLRVGVAGEAHGLWTISKDLAKTLNYFVQNYLLVNWLLCLFNLIPVPPLDGSHVIYHYFIRGRGQYYAMWELVRRWSFVVLILLLFATPLSTLLSFGVHTLMYASYVALGIPYLN